MNKVITSNVIVNDNILNLSQKVDSEVQIQHHVGFINYINQINYITIENDYKDC